MAQQYIKIFDDTVLKQSINQGYETQRTNSRLGKFTMGELAFTRDTARLFVGNSSTQNLDKDSDELIGGSLVGNKYLGLIDSKPLTHFFLINEDGETVESSVHFPLSYEEDTLSRGIKDNNGIVQIHTEKALLKSDSKFRTDKNKGWDKKANYNEKYDAYNGDFVFDTFNNALIIFDKNINPIEPETSPDWVMSNQIQQFKKPDGSIYGESGAKSNYSKFRTRLQNVPPPADGSNTTVLGNPNYPIYGNGYVVMRIIEPDGITLGYKERKFNQNTGSAEDGNYSHNYLEIKNVPAEILASSFSSDDFVYNSGANKIELANSITSPSSFPNTISFENGPTFTFSNTNDATGYVCVLPVTKNGVTKNLTQIKKGPYISIKVNGTTISHQITPNANLSFNFDEKEIENDTESNGVEEGYLIKQPFFMGNSIYAYSGTGFYFNGGLVSNERVPGVKNGDTADQNSPYGAFVLYDSSGEGSTYTPAATAVANNDEGTVVAEGEVIISGKFDHPYLNAGLNYLKKPEPIAWGKGGNVARGQFFINPFVLSPGKLYSSQNFGGVGLTESTLDLRDENEVYTLEKAESLDDSSLLNLMGVRIPDHAQSIICELHVPKYQVISSGNNIFVTTSTSWKDLTDTLSSSNLQFYDTINLDYAPSCKSGMEAFEKLKILTHILHPNSGDTNQSNNFNIIRQVEFPLYRDANGMKFFNVGIISPYSAWVLRAIGYRA